MSATVMIVDDEADVRLTVSLVIEPLGYRTVEASDGAEALELLSSAKPDLVVLDLRMPGVDGWEVLQQMRGESGVPQIPVIVLSAHSADSTKQRAFQLGCVDFIDKPFTAGELEASVKQALEPDPAPDGQP